MLASPTQNLLLSGFRPGQTRITTSQRHTQISVQSNAGIWQAPSSRSESYFGKETFVSFADQRAQEVLIKARLQRTVPGSATQHLGWEFDGRLRASADKVVLKPTPKSQHARALYKEFQSYGSRYGYLGPARIFLGAQGTALRAGESFSIPAESLRQLIGEMPAAVRDFLPDQEVKVHVSAPRQVSARSCWQLELRLGIDGRDRRQAVRGTITSRYYLDTAAGVVCGHDLDLDLQLIRSKGRLRVVRVRGQKQTRYRYEN